VQTLREVLRMRQLTPEQIGIEYRALLDLIGEERAIDLIGEERAIDLIGEERVVDLIGEERLVEDLLRRKGAQWLRAIIERSAQESKTAQETQPPAPPEV
jgi:hypothetical protein